MQLVKLDALRSALHPGGEFVKLEIYGFKESGTGGGVVVVRKVLHERS